MRIVSFYIRISLATTVFILSMLAVTSVAAQSPAGLESLWESHWNSAIHHQDAAGRIATSVDGRVVVSGVSYDPDTLTYHDDALGFGADGTLAWQWTASGARDSSGRGPSVRLANDEHAYVAGYENSRPYLRRFDLKTGLLSWEHPLAAQPSPAAQSGPAPPLAVFGSEAWMSVSDHGALHVFGFAANGTSVGDFSWSQPDGAERLPTDIAVAPNGDIVVTGLDDGTNENSAKGYRTVRFARNGQVRFADRYVGPTQFDLGLAFVRVRPDDTVVVVATPESAGGEAQVAVLLIAPDGSRVGSGQWPAKDVITAVIPVGMSLLADGRVVVAGYSLNTRVGWFVSWWRSDATLARVSTWNGDEVNVSAEAAKAMAVLPDGRVASVGYLRVPFPSLAVRALATVWNADGGICTIRSEQGVGAAADVATTGSGFALIAEGFPAENTGGIVAASYRVNRCDYDHLFQSNFDTSPLQ